MQIRKATTADFGSLEGLINLAYRSGEGWTHEAHIIQGPRISQGHIQAQFHQPHSIFLVAEHNGVLLGCVYVQREIDNPSTAEIGSFAVQPGLQNQGIGKQLLSAADNYAQQQWLCDKSQIWVVSGQEALLGFYRRRGYVDQASRLPYPLTAGVGTPLQGNIELIGLEKTLF